MVKTNNPILLVLLFAAFLFVGCKSTKHAQETSPVAGITLAEIGAMQAVQGTYTSYSAKIKLSANAGGNTLTSQGTLKLKDGEGAQISIAPLGLFEAARIEFAPLYVLMINRLKKEYSLVHYSNIPLLQQLGLNHALLQSVLQNRVYIPDDENLSKALSAMDITLEGDLLVLSTKANGITYKYYIEKSSGLLLKSIGALGNGTAVTCLYEGFQLIGGKMFPHSITLTLGGTAKAVELSFVLSKVKEDYEYTATSPSSSYKMVGVTDLLEALGGK